MNDVKFASTMHFRPHRYSTYICVHTYVHTYLHTYIHTYMRTYMHTYMHTYIYMPTHIHKHAYIHTSNPVNAATPWLITKSSASHTTVTNRSNCQALGAASLILILRETAEKRRWSKIKLQNSNLIYNHKMCRMEYRTSHCRTTMPAPKVWSHIEHPRMNFKSRTTEQRTSELRECFRSAVWSIVRLNLCSVS